MRRVTYKQQSGWMQSLSSFVQGRLMIVCASATLVCHSGVVGVSSACAQGTAESPKIKQVKESIVELYCRDRGHLAECVGLPANDCARAMRPLVDECYPEAMRAQPDDYAARFSSCFSMAFNKQYGAKLRETEDCVQPSYNSEAVKLSSKERESMEKRDVFGDASGRGELR